MKLFSTKKKHHCGVQTRVCIFSLAGMLHKYNDKYNDNMTLFNAFIFLVCSSLIDYGIACWNIQLNWTCPGGYIQLQKALWETYNTECGSTSEYYFRNAKPNLQNKCNNKTTCDFTATDSSLNVSCEKQCTGLDYIYKCISKSFVLHSLLIMF